MKVHFTGPHLNDLIIILILRARNRNCLHNIGIILRSSERWRGDRERGHVSCASPGQWGAGSHGLVTTQAVNTRCDNQGKCSENLSFYSDNEYNIKTGIFFYHKNVKLRKYLAVILSSLRWKWWIFKPLLSWLIGTTSYLRGEKWKLKAVTIVLTRVLLSWHIFHTLM